MDCLLLLKNGSANTLLRCSGINLDSREVVLQCSVLHVMHGSLVTAKIKLTYCNWQKEKKKLHVTLGCTYFEVPMFHSDQQLLPLFFNCNVIKRTQSPPLWKFLPQSIIIFRKLVPLRMNIVIIACNYNHFVIN